MSTRQDSLHPFTRHHLNLGPPRLHDYRFEAIQIATTGHSESIKPSQHHSYLDALQELGRTLMQQEKQEAEVNPWIRQEYEHDSSEYKLNVVEQVMASMGVVRCFVGFYRRRCKERTIRVSQRLP